MKKITIIWITLILLLTLTLTKIGINITKKIKPYNALEADIVEAMKVYYSQDTNLKKLPEKNKTSKITIDELEKFGIKINMNINNDKCIGYGIAKGKSVSFSYTAFIKCKHYTTEEYEKYK